MSTTRHALQVAEELPLRLRWRLARIAAELEPEDVARALGVSTRTYQRIEEGARQPRRSETIAFAQLTGQDLALFGASDVDDREGQVLPPPLPLVNEEGAGQ